VAETKPEDLPEEVGHRFGLLGSSSEPFDLAQLHRYISPREAATILAL
jgi:hypothetical protein